MIIGVTGTFSSGKDTVAAYLTREKGLPHFSTADELREMIDQAGLPNTREVQQRFSTELRQKEGDDVLERQVIQKIKDDAVITALRNTAGIDFLRSLGHFYLIATDVPIELRFKRARVRGRIGDGTTLEEFRNQENIERDGPGHQLDAVIAMADYRIQNTGDMADLYKQIEDVYVAILSAEKREGIENPPKLS